MSSQLSAGDRIGSYHLLKSLGAGGMAEVFLAQTKGIGGFQRLVALKVIHPSHSQDENFVEGLIDEAKVAVQLNHAHVAHVYDLNRVNDVYFIVMEFVDGRDLFKLMYEAAEREISLPLGVVLYITEAVALGLNYCHSKKDHYGRQMNLVHRDISPQNVFISWEGEIKILDFGIAKVSNRNRQTEAGVIKGKLQYMSPEQLNGEGFDHRSDLFSAGICLYEMLAGEMAYQEDDTLTLLRKIREADVRPLETLRPDLPPSITKVVRRALSRSPAQRFDSGETFAHEVREVRRELCPDFRIQEVGSFMRKVFGEQSFYLEDSLVDDYQEQNDTPSISVIFDQPYDGGESSSREEVEVDTTLFGSEDSASFNDAVLPTTLLESVESSLSGSSEHSSLGSLGVPTIAFEAPTGTPVKFPVEEKSQATVHEMEATLIDEEKGDLFSPSSNDSEANHSASASEEREGTTDGHNPFDASHIGTESSDFSRTQFRVDRFRKKNPWSFVKGMADHVRARTQVYVGGLCLLCILGLFLIENLAQRLPEQIELDVETSPGGALVFLGGKALGKMTPSTLELKRASLPITLMLQRDGYETVEVLLEEERLTEVENGGAYQLSWDLEPIR